MQSRGVNGTSAPQAHPLSYKHNAGSQSLLHDCCTAPHSVLHDAMQRAAAAAWHDQGKQTHTPGKYGWHTQQGAWIDVMWQHECFH